MKSNTPFPSEGSWADRAITGTDSRPPRSRSSLALRTCRSLSDATSRSALLRSTARGTICEVAWISSTSRRLRPCWMSTTQNTRSAERIEGTCSERVSIQSACSSSHSMRVETVSSPWDSCLRNFATIWSVRTVLRSMAFFKDLSPWRMVREPRPGVSSNRMPRALGWSWSVR